MIFIFFLGAFFNRIRGGWLFDLAQKYPTLCKIIIALGLMEKDEIRFVKDLNAIVYGIVFASVVGNYWLALVFYASMRAAFSFGWGGYIDGMINCRIDHGKTDVRILDALLSHKHPVFTCWLALSLRGLMASIILSIPFYFFTAGWIAIAYTGLLMGTIYLLACEICERVTFRGNGWQWGEVVFGGYLWATIYLLAGEF